MKRPDLSNTYLIAEFLTTLAGIPTTPAQIRQWSSRGHITRMGTSHNGLALYDPDEVYRHARREQRQSLRES